jgi:hypothetical protein
LKRSEAISGVNNPTDGFFICPVPPLGRRGVL